MKQIYLVINDISKIGGLSRVTLQLYHLFKKLGYSHIKIITGNLDFSTYEYWKEVEKDLINLNLGSIHNLESRFSKLNWYLRFLKKLKKIKLSSNTTIVGIETIINFLIFLAFKNKKVKLIGTEHIAFERRRITQFLKKVVYPRLDNLVVLTLEDEEKYKMFCKGNVKRIPNFINYHPHNRLENDRKKNILFVGKLEKVKGIDFLIEIIKRFPLKEWKFTIVGKGPLLEKAKKELYSYNVVFKGEVVNPKKEYREADIFILTSRKEGFPMVLLEAKSFGLPIVSFDIATGPKEIVRDGIDGFLVPFGNTQKFVEKLEILAKDDILYKNFSQQALQDIKRFNSNEIGKLWQEILS